MKTMIVRFLLLVTLLLTAGASSTLIAEGPVPQPACYPGELGCPK
jgi:hypothetical protein